MNRRYGRRAEWGTSLAYQNTAALQRSSKPKRKSIPRKAGNDNVKLFGAASSQSE